MYSKSIFGNPNSYDKSIINPVRNTTIPFYNNELKFTIEENNQLQHFLDINLMNQSPTYDEYIDLLNILSNLEVKTKNTNIYLLLKITEYGLNAMITALGIKKENIESNIRNMILQNKIDSILSTKNENISITLSETDMNKYQFKKKFTLSPLFSYYISFFGIPEEGLGFDITKLQLIKTILETNFIQPYA